MSSFDWGGLGQETTGSANAFDWATPGDTSASNENSGGGSSGFDWGSGGTTSSTGGAGGGASGFDWGTTAEEPKEKNVYGSAADWANWQEEAAAAAIVTKESTFFEPEASKDIKSGAYAPHEHDCYYNPNKNSPEGGVYTVGLGDCEQLGTGVLDMQPYYKPVPALQPPVAIRRIAAGAMHTLALSTTGELWSWGINDAGALGRSGSESFPGKVEGLGSSPTVQIAAGSNHCAVLAEDGSAWVWGSYRGVSGLVGALYEQGYPKSDEAAKVPLPSRLSTIRRRYGPITQISSASDHTLALTKKGVALSWGAPDWQGLGRAIPERENLRRNPALLPTPVEGIKEKVKSVFGSGYGSFVVTITDRVFGCGRNNEGQLGVGDDVNKEEFTEVEELRGKDIIWIAGDWKHTLFLTRSGAVYAAGNGDCGSLGVSTGPKEKPIHGAHSRVPLQVPAQYFNCEPVARISANGVSSAAVTTSGDLYTWGFGDNGALGSGGEDDVLQPMKVNELNKALSGKHIIDVSLGGQHAVALCGPSTTSVKREEVPAMETKGKRRASQDAGKRQRRKVQV